MKTKELFFISLTIFLTIIAWIVADVYHIVNIKTANDTPQTVIAPINTTIDTKVFDQLQKKQ